MDAITEIILTFVTTVGGGVLVFVGGQIIVRFFIDPYHEYRKLVGEIADALVYYANVTGSSREERQHEASNVFRQKASLLRVRAYAIPRYDWFVKANAVPAWNSIMDASVNLLALSNDVYGTDHDAIHARREIIIKNLKLPPVH